MTPKPFFKQPVFFLWIRCLYILNYLLWRPFGVVALGYRLATRRHQRVVAVTGSVGKTTATRAIMTLFHGDASARIHTGDNCFALVGLNLMRQGPRARWAVVEVGIGVPGQMAHYAATLQPDLVVMTALASDHVGRFAGDGALWEEKARMVRALRPRGVAVLNGDDAAVMRMASVTPARVVTFGFYPAATMPRQIWNATPPAPASPCAPRARRPRCIAAWWDARPSVRCWRPWRSAEPRG